MMHKFPITVIQLMTMFLVPTAVSSTTWYVNGVSGSNNNNCKSPTTACKTIGHAVSLAVSGDSIIVAAATYTERLRIGKSLTILGSGAATTIIAGGSQPTVVGISTGASVTLSKVESMRKRRTARDDQYMEKCRLSLYARSTLQTSLSMRTAASRDLANTFFVSWHYKVDRTRTI